MPNAKLVVSKGRVDSPRALARWLRDLANLYERCWETTPLVSTQIFREDPEAEEVKGGGN